MIKILLCKLRVKGEIFSHMLSQFQNGRLHENRPKTLKGEVLRVSIFSIHAARTEEFNPQPSGPKKSHPEIPKAIPFGPSNDFRR